MNNTTFKLSKTQLDSFKKNGYLIVRHWLAADALGAMQEVAVNHLHNPTQPWELEAQLAYPGAPCSLEEQGGGTIRRLLGAYKRECLWREFATSDKLKTSLQQLFDHPQILLSQAHHNCLMTKAPRYSSDTGWHQDKRYWRFEKNELITAWLALGRETPENGALRVIPGSHRLPLMSESFDERAFFLASKAENKQLIDQSHCLELNAGDLLFFHCDLLHSASRNLASSTKLSLVFTYHSGDNSPQENTRSASLSEIVL
ncbi:phytanoyl-CoA hydroxylase [Alteromonadaceae bacterium Bs31]|nr:phytanoyl-CoA hydroxylase [Alteromonadaceae bacterium Bs31]